VFMPITLHGLTLKAFAPIDISNSHLMEELVYVLSSIWMGYMVLVYFKFQECHDFYSILNLHVHGLNLFFLKSFLQ
jgi:hypothetical protein